jgi:protein-L-isoaspartate(D-aspartate) O-methyltransferase
MSLIEELISEKWLKTPEIIKAFEKIKREDFMPDDVKHLAELNGAIPIGQGQTISQPLVVAFMLELLQPKRGEKILDIGSGSGWTSALLAELVGERGKVFSLELLAELKEFGEKNVARYNFIEKGIVRFMQKDGSKGLKGEAPFDKILCSASVQGEVPQAWKEQVKVGGAIVAPAASSILSLVRRGENDFVRKEYPGFVFVPLIEK